MIYGRDEAALYPVVDLYDSGMMGLYINAAKDEYERGIKQQEDFISKYGDFISPFQKDVQNWDRLTMDPVIQTYDFLEKNGIDPLRSQEGRAAMASVMRQIPREKLSQLRQSAATGQQYLANRAKLQAEGKYNPEFEQFLLGDRQFGNYDTLAQGMWDRTAPTEYKGLRTLTDPWFQHRTLKFKGQKGGYDYYGYDEGDMRETANTQIKAFLASDYGRYFYDRAKRVAQGTATPGESQASIEKRAQDILMNDIVSANTDYLMNDRRVNQFALENLQHQHALARQRQAQAASRKAQQEIQKNNVDSWTGLLTNEVNRNKGQRQLARLIIGVKEIVNDNDRWMRYYDSKMKEVSKNSKQYAFYQKQKAFHKKQYDYYSAFSKNIASGKAGYTKDDFGNIKLTDFGERTLEMYNSRKLKQYKKQGDSAAKYAADYANTYFTEIKDPISRPLALRYISDEDTQITNNQGIKENRKVVSFGGSTNLARVTLSNLNGGGLRSKSASVRFNNYLRRNHVTGYAIPTSIKVAKNAKSTGGAEYNFMYYVDIPKEYLDKFNSTQSGNLKVRLDHLGASSHTITVGSGATATTEDVIRIPVIDTASETGLNTFTNSLVDKTYYGTSSSTEFAPSREDESIDYSTM